MFCVNLEGSCVYYSIATALEAANWISGVEVEELAWEELYDMVDEHNPCRTRAALRVLKYHGIHKRIDYKKVNKFFYWIKFVIHLHFTCGFMNLMLLIKLHPQLYV